VSLLGTPGNPLRVAIVGSGPSGFYAAEALLRAGIELRVDMLERLPAPFGLVRYGVAPDHPKLKEPILVYDRIARDPSFRFFGNVTVGRDVAVAELRRMHHAIVFACGAEADRRLGVAGEDLPGVHSALEFVGWYNGHPDYRDRGFDFSHEVAAIIGQGNVATDLCRVLAAPPDELARTDIAEHALAALARSRVREIHLIGRRGPAQAKFTGKELRELGELSACDACVDAADLVLNPESEAELADKSNAAAAKNLEIFRGFASQPAGTKPKRCFFRFLRSPVLLSGDGRLERLVLARNRLEGEPFRQVARATDDTEALDCGLLFRSIGFRGLPVAELPFDEREGRLPHRDGRLVDANGVAFPGLYATGWIKRGPTGLIGTNRADSVATVRSILADLPCLDGARKPGFSPPPGVAARLVSYGDWLRIDEAERARGSAKGKPREKFTRVEEMLSCL
jgi:ferredoxin/flavodoxin---NADP+ reductase